MSDTKKPAQKPNMLSGIGKSLSNANTPFGRMGRTYKIITAVVLVSLFLIAIMVLYLRSQILSLPHAQPPLTGPITGNMRLLSDGILTFNYSRFLAGYARIRLTETNATNATVTLSIYGSQPIRPIYLVNTESYCVQCFLETNLLSDLNASLSKDGLILNRSSLNYVDINKVNSIPKGAIVIIPSGLMPNILLPNITSTEGCPRYTNVTIVNLLEDGDVILYVGKNFTRSVSCTGQIVQNTNYTEQALGINTNYTNYNLTQNPLHFNQPTFAFSPGLLYGSATSIQAFNGTIIALSNYPTTGWGQNVTFLASDMATVLESRYWMDLLATGYDYGAVTPIVNATVYTLNTSIEYTGSVGSRINSSYALLVLNLSNANNSVKYDTGFRYTYRHNGLIGMPLVVGQAQNVQMDTQIFNSSGKTVIAYVPVYNENLTLAQANPIHVGEVGSSALYTYTSFQLPSGYYIANLEDQHGSSYSSALFYLENATITPTNLNFTDGTFIFSVSSLNQPISGAGYNISINGAYNSTGIVQNGQIVYTLPKGTLIGHGTGAFTVSLLGNSYQVPYQYLNTGVTVPPFYIEFGIAILFVVLLNRMLVPTNVDQYFIDVPDLRQSKREHAKEPPEAIIDVFEKVNLFYHWKYMPLTADEIKAGIGNNIKYGNTRISITLRNTYSILSTLMNKGMLQSADDYYAPSAWIQQSGHSIDYLAAYRKLRDYCISNAMMFTEMDASSKSDVIINSKGTQYFVKIYSKDRKITDLEISQRNRTVILFLDEESRLDFLDTLYKSYGRNAEILKMAVNYGNVRLVDTDNLDDLKL